MGISGQKKEEGILSWGRGSEKKKRRIWRDFYFFVEKRRGGRDPLPWFRGVEESSEGKKGTAQKSTFLFTPRKRKENRKGDTPDIPIGPIGKKKGSLASSSEEEERDRL